MERIAGSATGLRAMWQVFVGQRTLFQIVASVRAQISLPNSPAVL